jgi:Ca-activated chloride channel homolog
MTRRLTLGWLVLGAAALSLFGCSRPAPPASGGDSTAAPASTPAPQWPFSAAGKPTADASAADAAVSIKRNYYLVFDASGSMAQSKCSGNESKLAVAKRALVEFTSKLPLDVNLGLSVFDDRGVRELIPLGAINRSAAAQAIATVNAGGGTPLAESIQQAYAALTAQGRKQLGYGEYNLVVVTDGDASTADPRTVVDAVLRDSPVVLHTVGFCIGETHSLNQPGRVVYRAADNPAELASGLADVLAEAPTFDAQSFK